MELDATSQFDALIASYEAASLIIWITLTVIVVALIALGTEFWANLWGAISSPSLTFQRLLGEAQTVPGIVVIAVVGMASSAIALSFMSREQVIERVLDITDPTNTPIVQQVTAQLDSIFDQIGSDFSIGSNIEYVQNFTFQTRSLVLAIPIAFILIWLLWGLAGQLGSMIAGNKAGHGLTNLWAAVPYVFLLGILSTWLLMLTLAGHGWARVAFWLVQLYFLFLHVMMMREHGRYNIQSAIVATILNVILVPVFIVVLVVIGLFIAVQVENYL